MNPSITREVLFCRATGRRIPPERGRAVQAGSPIAVAVLDDGSSIPIFEDTVLGREPTVDRHVRSGQAEAWALRDPRHEISRCHLLLRRRGRRLEAVDLGSRNGTALAADGAWRPTMPGIGEPIVDGQQLRLGMRTITIHYVQR